MVDSNVQLSDSGQERLYCDLLGKQPFESLDSALRLLGVPGVLDERLPTEVKSTTIPNYVDMRFRIRVNTRLKRWRKVNPKRPFAEVHVEVVYRVTPNLVNRIGGYRAKIRAGQSELTPLLHYVLVAGYVPHWKRVRSLFLGWDEMGREVYIPVLYLDELPLKRLSPRDQRHPVAKILGIMQERGPLRNRFRTATKYLLGHAEREQPHPCWTMLHAMERWYNRPGQLVQPIVEELDMQQYPLPKEFGENMAAVIDFVFTRPEFDRDLLRQYFAPQVRKAKRELRQKLTQKLTQEHAQETQELTQAHQQELKKTQLTAIRSALRSRSIRLSPKQMAALRGLEYKQLPTVQLALTAKSANDFARRAGLPYKSNGAG